MKKLLIFLPLLFLVVFPRSVAFAHDATSAEVSEEVMVSPSTASGSLSPTPTVASTYTLPYPGILPDNPLYFLKTLRDRMIIFFISDPLKKSAFYLLQSDKRLESTWYLLKKDTGHTDLALSTLSKSTNYLSQAIDEVKNAKDAGQETGDMVGKLQQATQKHTAVIMDMTALPGLSHKDSFVKEEKRVLDLEKVVLKEVAQ